MLSSSAQDVAVDMFKPFIGGSGTQFEKLSGEPFWAVTPAKDKRSAQEDFIGIASEVGSLVPAATFHGFFRHPGLQMEPNPHCSPAVSLHTVSPHFFLLFLGPAVCFQSRLPLLGCSSSSTGLGALGGGYLAGGLAAGGGAAGPRSVSFCCEVLGQNKSSRLEGSCGVGTDLGS